VEVEIDKEVEEKMLEYLVALEGTNEQLIKSLKLCVEVLTAMHPEVPNQEN
jgi:hypothetical protein